MALQDYTSVQYGTSDQHKEQRAARQAQMTHTNSLATCHQRIRLETILLYKALTLASQQEIRSMLTKQCQWAGRSSMEWLTKRCLITRSRKKSGCDFRHMSISDKKPSCR